MRSGIISSQGYKRVAGFDEIEDEQILVSIESMYSNVKSYFNHD